MPRYTIPVLGLEITFVTDADAERVREATAFIEQQFNGLNQDGKNVSKEKLLTVLALSLADGYLQSNQKLCSLEGKMNRLLEKIDKADS